MKTLRRYVDRYYTYGLLILFLLVWVWSVWNPASGANWILENKMVVFFIPVIYLLLIRYIQFSKLSLTLVTLFISLHVVGAHYNYGSVPFGYTLSSLTGDTGGNMYDKLVHFSFGFLIIYPIREFFLRVGSMKGFWGYFVPFTMLMAMAAMYEMFEWVTVLQYPNDVAYLFIGGNDPFDTTKDLFVAMIGGILTLIIVALLEWVDRRDKFWKAIKKSFFRDRRDSPAEDRILHKDLI